MDENLNEVRNKTQNKKTERLVLRKWKKFQWKQKNE